MGTLLSCLSGEHPYPEEVENTGRRDKTTNSRYLITEIHTFYMVDLDLKDKDPLR